MSGIKYDQSPLKFLRDAALSQSNTTVLHQASNAHDQSALLMKDQKLYMQRKHYEAVKPSSLIPGENSTDEEVGSAESQNNTRGLGRNDTKAMLEDLSEIVARYDVQLFNP